MSLSKSNNEIQDMFTASALYAHITFNEHPYSTHKLQLLRLATGAAYHHNVMYMHMY